MGYYAFNPAKIVSGSPIIYDESGQQLIALSHTGGVTTQVGAEATGDDFILKANGTDDYPYIKWNGNGWLAMYGKGGVSFYEQITAMLQVTYSANVTTVAGGSVAGDDAIFKANASDPYPTIEMDGGGGFRLKTSAGTAIQFCDGATSMFAFALSSPDMQLHSYDNKNLALVPNGTGKVKFGTYAAGVAGDSTGYIPILDAAGNTRKLMVQA